MKKISIVLFVLTFCVHCFCTDYYVDAVNGSNIDSDGTAHEPWQTITYALSQANGTSQNPVTIYILEGTYDTSMTPNYETFPLYMEDYVSLVGEEYDSCAIDAEETNYIIEANSVDNFSIEGLTLLNGIGKDVGSGIRNGGSMYINSSDFTSLLFFLR